MSLTFQSETCEQFAKDAPPLWIEHYNEIAADKERTPLAPDFGLYHALEAQGALVLLTARDEGRLVGYFIAFLRQHPHYANTLCGFEDLYFLTADYRKGMAGVRLLKAAEAALKERSVEVAFFHTKARKDLGAIFERMGFTKADIIYRKRLN